MKAVLITLFAFLFNSVAVLGESGVGKCSNMRFTFNLKPQYPFGSAEDYVCGDADYEKLEDILRSRIISVMTERGYTSVSVGNASRDHCARYPCTPNPGNACIPMCLPVYFCVGPKISHEIKVIDVKDLALLQVEEVDGIREELPACLGLKNKFMADLNFSFL